MDPDSTKLETAPTSKRFPTTNQAKACYMYYNSWHQCMYDYSKEEPQCEKLQNWAAAMCPVEWVRCAMLPPPPPSLIAASRAHVAPAGGLRIAAHPAPPCLCAGREVGAAARVGHLPGPGAGGEPRGRRPLGRSGV